ncbi:MAG: chemotaxis protein CheW [Gammaproteobacteria bacterium]|nr:chemotaxis protein CheW [Gammaproteobacteria bacterium]
MLISTINLLIFKVGPVPCCVDSNAVQVVIEPPQHITAIPGSNALRPGLFSYMKKTVAVYDVRTKFSLATEQRGKILIVDINHCLFGFWVDTIEEIISSASGKWQPMPAECPKDIFDGILLHKKQLIFKTDFDKLVKVEVTTQTQVFIHQLLQAGKDNITDDNDKPHRQSEMPAKTADANITDNKTAQANKTKRISDKTTKHKITDALPAKAEKKIPAAHTNNAVSAASADLKTHSSVSQNTDRAALKPALSSTSSIKAAAMPAPFSTPATRQQAAGTETTTGRSLPSQSHTSPAKKQEPIKPASRLSPSGIAVSKPLEKAKPSQSYSEDDENNISPAKNISLIILLLLSSSGASLYFFNLSTRITPENATLPALIGKNTNAISSPAEILVHESPGNTQPESAIADNNSLATSITEDKTTITITIDDSEARFNSTSTTEKPEVVLATSKTEGHNSERHQAIARKNSDNTKNNKSSKIKSNKIIHIVVEGDTLWHIAKHYISDPFKYKQIAKLSQIKNPDRIYPGNRIIIIIKK